MFSRVHCNGCGSEFSEADLESVEDLFEDEYRDACPNCGETDALIEVDEDE